MSRAISASQTDRAKMHAALGEPVRLAIAESLAVGDLSAKELAVRFDLPTNLLAHHLRVMESAGLITRRRSEGDGRRTYVHLRTEETSVADLIRPAVMGRQAPRRVLFVCTHNSARSQLAAAEWKRASKVPVASAGTHPADAIHRRAIATAKRHKLSLGASTQQVAQVRAKDDLVVAVCDQAHEELAATGQSDAIHWSIPDPVRQDTTRAFETAFDDIRARVVRLADAWSPLPDPTPRSIQ